MGKRKLTAAKFINVHRRVSPHDVKFRLIERDARQRAETRTEAEKWLGDPPTGRSALAQRKQM
jgi:hypothetical protein